MLKYLMRTQYKRDVQAQLLRAIFNLYLIYIKVLAFKMRFRQSHGDFASLLDHEMSPGFPVFPLAPFSLCFQPGAAHRPGVVQVWRCLVDGGRNRRCCFEMLLRPCLNVKSELLQQRQMHSPVPPSQG